ncbi:MAG: hypothetical protein ACOCZ5_00220 [bacterium]
MSRYSRTKFMRLHEVNDRLEYDLLSSNWDLFKIKRPFSFGIIIRSDLGRPDLFSLRIYNRIDYWWIISKINNIDDWFNDVYIGMEIIIPDVEDIEEFYLDVKNRRANE